MASEGTRGDTGDSGNMSSLARSMGRKRRRDGVPIPANLVPVMGRCFICGTSPSMEDKANKSGSEGT